MSRAHALRRLAQEFPPEVERQLSLEDRHTLGNLWRDHLAAFAKESGQMEATLTPLLRSLAALWRPWMSGRNRPRGRLPARNC